MQQVSSSWTVILKFFVPTIWISMFATFALGAFLSEESMLMGMPIARFRIGTLIFLAVGIVLLYWMVMRLKRVEMDHQHLYITNYRKRLRYSFDSIEKITEKDWGLFKTVLIHLKSTGQFGKKISFVASKQKFNRFLREHPQVAQRFMET